MKPPVGHQGLDRDELCEVENSGRDAKPHIKEFRDGGSRPECSRVVPPSASHSGPNVHVRGAEETPGSITTVSLDRSPRCGARAPHYNHPERTTPLRPRYIPGREGVLRSGAGRGRGAGPVLRNVLSYYNLLI